MEWLPIETAPKDGADVLVLFQREEGLRFTAVAQWMWDGMRMMPGSPRRYGWGDPGEGIYPGVATHWLPIPAFPAPVSHETQDADAP